jgi:hypothetical protein
MVNELRVSAHLMALEPGLFCIVCNPSKAANGATGLPGVRVTLPPGSASRPEAVSISTFRDDGWLAPFGDAALVRVVGGPAHVLVTVYQAPNAPDGTAPNLQVLRLTDSSSVAAPAPAQAAPAAAAAPKVMDMVAHIMGRGDVGGMLGEWLGAKGANRWIEGFAIGPAVAGLEPGDLEYQAVLGRDWLSPWVEGGQFCGSRGMSLPLLGLRLRLRGEAANKFDCSYSASFVDGTDAGPVSAGEACQSESLAALEALMVTITPRGEAAAPAPRPATRKPVAKAETKPASRRK